MFEDSRTFRNDGSKPYTVWLEPLASDYVVHPGEEVRIAGASPTDGEFEVVDYGDKIGVYVWAGACVEVYRNGELYEDFPAWADGDMPGGGSLREFMEAMFGGPGGPSDVERKPRFWRRYLRWGRKDS